jgi:hypothetical protein
VRVITGYFMPGTPIPNPGAGADSSTRININIEPRAFVFFFRGCLAGDRGAAGALTNTFFTKLHEACVAEGVSPTWDPDNNGKLIDILNRLNFNPPVAIQPTGQRRANRGPAKRKQNADANPNVH